MVLKNEQREAPSIPYGYMNMQNDFRALMAQEAFMARSYMASIAAGFGNADAIAGRLYNLPVKFTDKVQLIFGAPVSEKLLALLQIHVINLTTLVYAMKKGDHATVDGSIVQLYKNADEIAAYFAKMNPFWDATQWRNLIYSYIAMTMDQAVALMAGDFEKDLDIFDRTLYHAFNIGDYISSGVIQYLSATQRRPVF